MQRLIRTATSPSACGSRGSRQPCVSHECPWLSQAVHLIWAGRSDSMFLLFAKTFLEVSKNNPGSIFHVDLYNSMPPMLVERSFSDISQVCRCCAASCILCCPPVFRPPPSPCSCLVSITLCTRSAGCGGPHPSTDPARAPEVERVVCQCERASE